jgi:hypothetical protein
MSVLNRYAARVFAVSINMSLFGDITYASPPEKTKQGRRKQCEAAGAAISKGHFLFLDTTWILDYLWLLWVGKL